MALDAGADFAGFVLYAPSPRAIAATNLVRLLDKLDAPARIVAVLVNESRAFAERLARDAALRAVQLHGEERSEDFLDFPVPVWRSVRFENGRPNPDPALWQAERFVADANVPGKRGGTGVTADWPAANRLARQHPTMLAGGLTSANVGEAIRAARPMGVDTAGGVERAPGRKDPMAVRAFIRCARQTERKT